MSACRARIVSFEDDPELRDIDRLSRHYTGRAYPNVTAAGSARGSRSTPGTAGAPCARADPHGRRPRWARPGVQPVAGGCESRGTDRRRAERSRPDALDAQRPAPGPRRVLRLRGAARQALAARPPGHRRRGRRPRRGRHGVVRGARVRRPLGDGHRGGTPALPGRHRVPVAPLGGLPRQLADGDVAAGGGVAPGRAGLGRRGVRRPGRGPPAPT